MDPKYFTLWKRKLREPQGSGETIEPARLVTVVYGPESTDPRCVYDPDTKRWFVTNLVIELDPATGGATGETRAYIAVSQTSDPTDSRPMTASTIR